MHGSSINIIEKVEGEQKLLQTCVLTKNIKCELCEYISKDKSHHEEHFEHEHGEEEWTVGCVFPKCEFETPSPEDLIKHFQANHDKWIQKSIKKKCLRLISG